MLDHALILEACDRLKKRVRRTELIPSHHFGEKIGGHLWFKCENLQRTGAFKLRGALNFMTAQSRSALARGVITASAGNHAQGLAYAADLLGVGATVYMPEQTPLQKILATRDYGAEVVLTGRTFDEACAAALAARDRSGALFVHPFDDPLVMAGQGTIGIEILEELPDLERLVVSIGGGGLIAGIATAIKAEKPSVRIVGVQTVAAPAMEHSFRRGRLVQAPVTLSLADGIAVKRPGEHTFPIIRDLVDEVVLVEEEEIARAIVALLEKTKLLVEGAGAVTLAALLNDRVSSRGGKTVCLLSGGNIDVKTIAAVVERGLLAAGRYLRLSVELEDTPGAMARLTADIAAANANIYLINHDRRSQEIALGRTEVRLELETRGHEHMEAVVAHLRNQGYELKLVK